MDLFVQGFQDGEARPLAREVFDHVFGEHVAVTGPDLGFCRLRTPDGGEADIHIGEGPFSGFVMNHFSAGDVLDLVVEFARRADAVIMPIGCPTLLARPEQFAHLPIELQADARVVTIGADVAKAIAQT